VSFRRQKNVGVVRLYFNNKCRTVNEHMELFPHKSYCTITTIEPKNKTKLFMIVYIIYQYKDKNRYDKFILYIPEAKP